VSITTVTYLREDVKWDFEVPGPHNYVAGGVVHHNSGKTTAGCAMVVSMALGMTPWNEKRTRFRPPIKIRICGEDQGHHLREILVPKLHEFVPKEEIKAIRKSNAGLDAYWTFKNGSTIELMSYEQDDDVFEGWDGHLVWFDEPPPRSKYIALKRGLVDHKGIALLTFTPLKEPWIYDELVTNPDRAVRFINADIRDNPYLDEGAIAEFERSLTDEEKATRIKGGWLFLQGLVYKEFNPTTHVIKPFKVPSDYTVGVAIDPHPRTEQALLFVAVDEKERAFVVHEKFAYGSPDEIADWIIDYHKHTHEIDLAIIDPASQGDKNRGDTTYDILERRLSAHGITLEFGSKDLSGGILQVRNALQSRNGLPSLYFFDNAHRTIFELTRYVWDDWRHTAGDRSAKQRPRDKDDHQMENLRRLLQHPLQHRQRGSLADYLRQANAGYSPADPIAGY